MSLVHVVVGKSSKSVVAIILELSIKHRLRLVAASVTHGRNVMEALGKLDHITLFEYYFRTTDKKILSFIFDNALERNIVIVVQKNKIIIYDNKMLFEIPCTTKHREKIVKYFSSQAKKLHLRQKPIEFRLAHKKSDALKKHGLFAHSDRSHTSMVEAEDFKQVSDSKCSVM